MYQYLVTTTTVDDTPELVVIGRYSDYIDHLTKYRRVSYCFGRSTRVAKACNIAIINYDSPRMYQLMLLLKSTPFQTFNSHMGTINLQSEYPELLL